MDIKKTTIYSLIRRIYKEAIQNKYIGKIENYDWKQLDVSKEFDAIRSKVIKYLKDIENISREGCFANSTENQSIYAYTYFVMLRGLLEVKIENVNKVASYLVDSQLEDGFFYETDYLNYRYITGDGWGKRHFIPHVIIALERLNRKPTKDFVFLEPFYSKKRMRNFLDKLNWNNAWVASNSVMNITVCLQYARDYMGVSKAEGAIQVVQSWLLSHIQEESGMWYTKKIRTIADKYEAIRCAYHLYPLLDYDGIEIPYREKAIDLILSVQNKYGGFDTRRNSSACEDIDAVDSLIRLARKTKGYRDEEIKKCLKRAFLWIKQNQMQDGGFVFRKGEEFDYGCDNVMSKVNESNMFATWFRMLSLCYIHDYLTNYKRDYVNLPGYEYSLFEE